MTDKTKKDERHNNALAPPSGEGEDAPPAWQNLDNAEAEFLRNLADNGGLAPLVAGMLRHCARLLDRTTPQSAPVDVNSPQYEAGFKDGLAFEAEHRLFTPPPASQERGRLQVFHCREADDGEAGCAKWCGNRTYCPVSGQAEPSPPSSAADYKLPPVPQPEPVRTESGSTVIPNAAEQAKPVTVENAPIGTIAPAIGGGHWYRVQHGWKWNGPNGSGGTFPRPGGDWNGKLTMPVAEQTQAVERITTLPLWDELELEAAIHPNQYKANCLREAAALLRRLAGGVTVDDAMVKSGVNRYAKLMDDGCHNRKRIVREVYEVMQIAALGAK